MAGKRGMSRLTRIVLIVCVSAVATFALAVGVTAAAIYRAGTISVELQSDRGADWSLRIPAGLAEVAIALTLATPVRKVGRELQPWSGQLNQVWPVLISSYDQLATAPDFVLVEITSDDERIVVRKQEGRLVVDVDSGGEEVHVVVPMRTVRRALSKIEHGLVHGRASRVLAHGPV